MNLICPLAKDFVSCGGVSFQGKILKYLRRKIIYLEFSAAQHSLYRQSGGIYEHDAHSQSPDKEQPFVQISKQQKFIPN